jgi:hypothetical protein
MLMQEPTYVLPLLEQYSLNTTFDVGEPLISGEVSCTHIPL